MFKQKAKIDSWLQMNRGFFSTANQSRKRCLADIITYSACYKNMDETDFCSTGLELRCSYERHKRKFMAIKGILEAQRLLILKGYSSSSTYFILHMAEISSVLTMYANYMAKRDAMVIETPILNTTFPLNSSKEINFHDCSILKTSNDISVVPLGGSCVNDSKHRRMV